MTTGKIQLQMQTDLHRIRYRRRREGEKDGDDDDDDGGSGFVTSTIKISHRKLVGTEEEGEGGEEEEEEENDKDDEFAIDPYFFDDGYSVAATTGFARVWEGASVFTDFLVQEMPELTWKKKVVELGSGVGLCGLAVAIANEANVTLTDLPSVVEGILIQNIEQNSTSLAENGWYRVIGTHGGSARAVALNWEKPMVCHQLTTSGEERDAIDVIIAAECIWLADLLDCFCVTLNILIEREKKLRNRSPKCFVCCRDRSRKDSKVKVFASEEMVEAAFRRHALEFEVLREFPSTVEQNRCVKIYSISKK